MGWLLKAVPTFAPALKLLANPWMLLAAAAAVAVIFAAGLKTGVDFEQGKQAERELRAERAWTKYLNEFFARQRAHNDAIRAQLLRERAQAALDRETFKEALDAANRKGPILKAVCPGPKQPAAPRAPSTAVAGPAAADLGTPAAREPAGGVVCDDACVRLWNDAIAVGLPEPHRGRFADAAASVAGPVGDSELFANLEENSARCNAIRSVAQGWQRKACLEGWWKGPECEAVAR